MMLQLQPFQFTLVSALPLRPLPPASVLFFHPRRQLALDSGPQEAVSEVSVCRRSPAGLRPRRWISCRTSTVIFPVTPLEPQELRYFLRVLSEKYLRTS